MTGRISSALAVLHGPAVSRAMGTGVTVRKVWPGANGSLTFEARETDTGRIRAGSVSGDGCIRAAPYGCDPALESLRDAARGSQLLIHRYGRRAVLRHVHPDGQSTFTKVVRQGKAPALARTHSLAEKLPETTGITVPRLLRQDSGSITLSAVAGTDLHRLGRAAAADMPGTGSAAQAGWEAAWRLFPGTWPHFAEAPRGALPFHTAEDECRTVAQWAGHADAHGALQAAGTSLGDAVERVNLMLLATPAQAPVLCHRDLHDKQILVGSREGGLGLIDFDTLSTAEPALDLGNLLAHVEFRYWQGLLLRAAATHAEGRILEAADSLCVDPARLQAYRVAAAVRIACVYAFRPPYRPLAHDWFAHILGRLGQRGGHSRLADFA